jgi:hypothetical protein
MTNSRQCVKSSKVTLKKDFEAMAKRETENAEKLKRLLMIEKDKVERCNSLLESSEENVIYYREKYKQEIEANKSIKLSKVILISIIGFIAGVTLMYFMKGA